MCNRQDCFIGYARVVVVINALLGLVTGVSVHAAQTGTSEYFSHAEFKANASSLTMITFDDLGRGNGILKGNEYAARGITIVQRDRHPINVLSAKDNQYYHPTNFNSQPNGISSANGVNNRDWLDRSDNFDFIFSKAVNAAGLWVGNVNGTTEVQYLTAGQCVIAKQKIDGNHKNLIKGPSKDLWDNRIFYGIATNQRIERIRVINGANDGDGIVLDDVQFGSGASKPLGEAADQSIRIFTAVPTQNSSVFKSATHKSLRMVSPGRWDPIPYQMTQPFTQTITAKPGQRFFFAGDSLGKTGWRVDNFILIEIESAAGIQRFIMGNTDGSPVEYQGQRLRHIEPSADLSQYFPKNVPFRLTVSALDFGGVGHISDLFLVARDASGCPETIGTATTTPKVADAKTAYGAADNALP